MEVPAVQPEGLAVRVQADPSSLARPEMLAWRTLQCCARRHLLDRLNLRAGILPVKCGLLCLIAYRPRISFCLFLLRNRRLLC